MQRRHMLQGAAALTALWATGASAQKSEPIPELRIVIPANPGGGWDQTGRALGNALMMTKLVDRVQYENIGGKAGTVGLAQFVERYSKSPNTLLVGGMVMLGGIALQRPAVDLSSVTAVAELTNDIMVLAVPATSPVRSIKDLTARFARADFTATVVGGSSGGVDHMLLGMIMRAARVPPEKVTYLATSSGGDAVKALTEGKAEFGISGYSEFRSAIDSGSLRALAVSSRRGRFGLPSLRDGGIDTELTNWRGVFAPRGITAAQLASLSALVERVARTPEWADLVRRNDWQASYRGGADFASFVENEQTMARVVVHMLKLKG